jgi:uncharacterized protein YjbI with pentapeptide repeats
MGPDRSLKRVDFSKAVSAVRAPFNNWPEGALTISFWIQWRPSGNSSDANIISYADSNFDMDHPNRYGPRFLVKDPSNLTFWFQGTSASCGLNIGDGKWHHLAITLEQDPPQWVTFQDDAPPETPDERARRTIRSWNWWSFSWVTHENPAPPRPRPPPEGGFVGRTVVSVYRDGGPAGQCVLQTDAGESLRPGGPFQVKFPFNEGQDRDGSSNNRFVEGLGSIAEVRVWNGARTAKQLAVEMTGYLTSHPDLRLYWPLGFSDRIESTLRDGSGNGNDGRFEITTTPRWNNDPMPWPPAPMDLSGVDLSNANIQGIPLAKRNLSGAVLASTNLDGADLSGANLFGANMSKSSLKGVNLTGASLHATNFTETDLTFTSFSPQPDWSRDANNRTVLDKAIVPLAALGRDWSFLHLTGAYVLGLDSGVDLSGINASNIVFQNAGMSGVRFMRARFDGADLTGARLNEADLSNANMSGAVLYSADLSGTTLSQADLTRARFGGVSGQGVSAVLSYAYMPGVKLTSAELYGVDLAYAQIYAGAKMDGAHLEGANFAFGNLSDMDFTQAYMKGVDMSGAVLVRCNFKGVDLGPSQGNKPSSLAGAHLQGADFTACNLAGANLSGAAVATAPGEITIQRVDNTGHLVPATETYKATALPMGAGDQYTTWPDFSRGMLARTDQLIAPDPPKPPECIPSLTQFCPRKKVGHRG